MFVTVSPSLFLNTVSQSQRADRVDTDSLINEYLVNQREERGKRGPADRTFYCSEIGYCPRKLYYKRVMPKDYSVETLKVFILGDMIHEKMTEILGFKYKELESEGRLCLYIPTEDIRISGKYDDLIRTEDDEAIVIEKKSVASLYYINKPHGHHELQAMLYMKALGVDKAYIIYIEKNTLKTKTYPIEFNLKTMSKALDKAAGVQKCLDQGVLPPKQPIGAWECGFCNWRSECGKEFCPRKEEK